MTNAEDADAIHLQELELEACLGVPKEERAQFQRLTISITMWPSVSFDELQDQLEQTVDYSAVAQEVKELARAQANKLIETLAEQIASQLLRNFRLRKVRLELRKFILPDTKYVAVILSREARSAAPGKAR